MKLIRSGQDNKEKRHTWFRQASDSAVYAALTPVPARTGLEGVNSNPAAAIRRMVMQAAA